MKRLLLATLLLPLMGAQTEPAPVAQRLVAFAHDACVYITAHPWNKASERRRAAHFGRIIRVDPPDAGVRNYVLAVPRLSGWDVEVLEDQILFDKIPVAEQPLLHDLVLLLGAPQEEQPSADSVLHEKMYGHLLSELKNSQIWSFKPAAEWLGCTIQVEVDRRDLAARVTRFVLSAHPQSS